MKTEISELEAKKVQRVQDFYSFYRKSPTYLHKIRTILSVCKNPRQLSKNDLRRLVKILKFRRAEDKKFTEIFQLPDEPEESEYDSDETVCE